MVHAASHIVNADCNSFMCKCVLHLAGFDGMRLIQDYDLGSQLLQLVLQLGHKVVAGDQELELLAFQLAVFTLCDHVDTVICDAKPLVQCICPLLCIAHIQDDPCACCAYRGGLNNRDTSSSLGQPSMTLGFSLN